jgi:hypothetical protein
MPVRKLRRDFLEESYRICVPSTLPPACSSGGPALLPLCYTTLADDRRACLLMQVRLDPGCLRIGVAPAEFCTSSPSPSPQPCTSPNWTIDVSDVSWTIHLPAPPLSCIAAHIVHVFFVFFFGAQYHPGFTRGGILVVFVAST